MNDISDADHQLVPPGPAEKTAMQRTRFALLMGVSTLLSACKRVVQPTNNTGPPPSISASSTNSPPVLGDIIGDWQGTLNWKDSSSGVRFVLIETAASLGGELLFDDPQTHAWVHAGVISGQLSDAKLHINTDSGAIFDLTLDSSTLRGTGILPDDTTGALAVDVTASHS